MKLLLQSAMIFFGTLMAAAVVALGEPGKSDVAVAREASAHASAQRNAAGNFPWTEFGSARARFEPR
jgi:hypothetical protein